MKKWTAIPCAILVATMGISCTDEEAEKPRNPEAKSQPEDAQTKPDTPPAPAPKATSKTTPAKELGKVDAKANDKTAAITFKVATALISNSYDKFAISLSDVADDPVDDLGQFPPSDDPPPAYHRVVLKFEEAPKAPGTFPLKGLLYSVKDEAEHFNFGWSGESVKGTATITKLSGELPAGETGLRARPEAVEGKFEATNKYGGVFNGSFKAVGIPSTKE